MSTTPKALGGTLTLSGSLNGDVYASKALAGAVSISGSVGMVVYHYPLTYPKNLYGFVAASGSLKKHLDKELSATIVLTKNTSWKVEQAHFVEVAGTLVAAGSLGTIAKHLKALQGSLTLGGESLIYYDKKSLAGEVELTGTLLKNVGRTLTAEVVLSGEGTPTRGLYGEITIGREIPEITLAGTLSLGFGKRLERTLTLEGLLESSVKTGELTLSGSVLKNVSKALTGSVDASGSLTLDKTLNVLLEGTVKLMKVLTYGETLHDYTDASPLNRSAKEDITIEQGASFARNYRWMKSDGIPFDLSGFALKMVITKDRVGGEVIASTADGSITITKSLIDPGVFLVEIAKEKTAFMDFTRATYEITATWRTYRARLVEGEVVLNRTRFANYPVAFAGAVAASGSIRKNFAVTLTRSMALTGSQSGS